MPENRKALLDSIGFVWRVEAKEARASLYQKQWEQQLEGLIQYKLIHGNCEVPANFEKKGLGVWVVVQKEAGRKGSLDPQRAEKLLSTGLTWGDERETCWTRSFVKLQAYVVAKEMGTEVSFEEIASFDSKLGNWIKLQCIMRNHNKLSLKRAFLLENIGCRWEEAKMVVAGGGASPRGEAQLQEEPKGPTIPFVPDLASSGPMPSANATNSSKRDDAHRDVRTHIETLRRNRPQAANDGTGSKRQIHTIHSVVRRGRDPPGDPPGKRVRRMMEDEPIPMLVRSDPPGAVPCQVQSVFTL